MRASVFLDECDVTTDLLRRYGRSLRGTRVRDHTPCSHWQSYTVIAALRLDGLTAPAVFDGPIDTPSAASLGESSTDVSMGGVLERERDGIANAETQAEVGRSQDPHAL
jgi:hypothetical protein